MNEQAKPVRGTIEDRPYKALSRLVHLRCSSYNSYSPNHLREPSIHSDSPGSSVVIRGLRCSALLLTSCSERTPC